MPKFTLRSVLFCMDSLLSVITFTNGHNFFSIYLAFVKNNIETSQWYYCYHEIAKTLLWCYCNLGRYSTNVYTGEATPWGPTSYSFIYHFSWKRYRFHIPFIDKWHPFPIPCLELCIPFNCCECTVFLTGINQKSRAFSRLYKAIKYIHWAFRIFHRPKWQISSPFILQRVKSLPFHLPEAW